MTKATIVLSLVFAPFAAQARPCAREDLSKFTGNYVKNFATCNGIYKVYPCDGWGDITGGEVFLDKSKKPKLAIVIKAPKNLIPGRKDNRLFLFDSGKKEVECGEAGGNPAVKFTSKEKGEATLTLDGELVRFKQHFEMKQKVGRKSVDLEVGLMPAK